MQRILLYLTIFITLSACSTPPALTPTLTLTPPPTVTHTPTLTPTPTQTLTPTFLPSPTPLASDTPSITNTPEATLSPTTAVLTGTLAFGSNLREGPGRDYASRTFIDEGEVVTIIGRDGSSQWLYVQTEAETEGWIRITQFTDTFDPASIPLAQDALDLLTTITPVGTPTP